MYIAVINFCANLNVYKYVCNDVGVVYNVEVYCSPSFQVLIVLVTHKSLLKMMTSSDTKYSERDSNPQPSVSKTDALPLSHPSTFSDEAQNHYFNHLYTLLTNHNSYHKSCYIIMILQTSDSITIFSFNHTLIYNHKHTKHENKHLTVASVWHGSNISNS